MRRTIYSFRVYHGTPIPMNVGEKILLVSALRDGPGVEVFYEMDLDADMQIWEFQLIPTGGVAPEGWEHAGSATYSGSLGGGIVYHLYRREKL